VWRLEGKSGRDLRHLRLRLLQRRVVAKPANHLETVGEIVTPHAFLRPEHVGQPHVGGVDGTHGIGESWRHDAEDLEVPQLPSQGPFEDARIPAEAA
jgi:hypothetical protein